MDNRAQPPKNANLINDFGGSTPRRRPFGAAPVPPIQRPISSLRQARSNQPAPGPVSHGYGPLTQSPAQAPPENIPDRGAIPPGPLFGTPSTKRERSDPSGRIKKPRLFSWARLKAVPRKKLIIRSLLVLLVLILIPGGWLGWKFYRNVAKVTHNNNPLNLLSAFNPVPLKGQDGRVNILVAGDSVDRTDRGGGGDLTDSIMILSIDTKNKTAMMLSVPRDLWVPLPSYGHQKINAANTLTSFSQNGYPKGGMGMLEKVITDNLGVTINYYALVNYTAFKDAVNAVGGITVDIESPDPRGLYDPQPYGNAKSFKLPNGIQTLNGDMALNLARARGDAYRSYGFPHSDFDRTAHQRQMVLALKDKASSPSVIANPFKIGELADAMGNNITTDMKLNEMETLYTYIKKINNTDIQSNSINDLISGKTLLKNYTTDSGVEALIPAAGIDDFSQIEAAIKRLLSNDPIAKEGAQVVVLNGGDITGLAARESTILKGKSVDVVATASPAKTYPTTTIVDKSNGQKPATLKLLESMFGTTVVKSDPAATNYTADFVIILGQNQPDTPANTSGASYNNSPSNTGN